MAHDLSARKAGIGDLNDLVTLYQAAVEALEKDGIFQWDSLYPDEDILREDVLSGNMFLTETGGRIVSAFVVNQSTDGYENAAWRARGSFAVLHRLCVDPHFQNMGIGTQTVRIAEGILRETGAESVRLDAFSQNPWALRLYEKLGYARVGKTNYRKGLFYLYEKIL